MSTTKKLSCDNLTDRAEIGRRIRASRCFAGLTEYDLGVICDLEVVAMGQVEEGKRPIQASWIPLIAAAVKQSEGYLLGESNKLMPMRRQEKRQLRRHRAERGLSAYLLSEATRPKFVRIINRDAAPAS